MATNHIVKQGEHLSQIAETYGFLDHRLIWEHPNNASLKNQRKNPWVLYPGDRVYIPDKPPKTESLATTKVHIFRLHGETLLLRIALRDHEDNPIANTPLRLDVEGSVKSLTTDGSGKTQREIPRSAVRAMMTVTNLEVPLKVGHLDPVDTLSGQKARLNNLGYDAGDPAGPEDMQFRAAVEEFQCDQHLNVNGMCDAATQAKLTVVHGC